jgi:hypothetical protein
VVHPQKTRFQNIPRSSSSSFFSEQKQRRLWLFCGQANICPRRRKKAAPFNVFFPAIHSQMFQL